MNEPVDILLVEDSEDDAEFFAEALRAANPVPQVHRARDGAEALVGLFGNGDWASAVPLMFPRLIVLDLNLPKVSGLEVLRHLKANPYTRIIPVVTLSSSRESRDLVQGYQLGANSYLVKPVDFDRFSETVRLLNLYWLKFNHPPAS